MTEKFIVPHLLIQKYYQSCMHKYLAWRKHLRRVFQVLSEGKSLIQKKKSSEICIFWEIANICKNRIVLTTKLYKNPNFTAILGSEKLNLEGKAAIYTETMSLKNQKQMTSKQPATWKIIFNEIHSNLVHP